MKTIINLDELEKIEQIEAFLAGTQPVVFVVIDDKTARYAWLERTMKKHAAPFYGPSHRSFTGSGKTVNQAIP